MKHILLNIEGKEFIVPVKARKSSPTMCARVLGVTITVQPSGQSSAWSWSAWCDNEDVAKRLHAAIENN
jgi:hypothetical protein